MEDLAWSKLEEVMKHAGLDKQSAVSVFKLVPVDPSVARMNQDNFFQVRLLKHDYEKRR